MEVDHDSVCKVVAVRGLVIPAAWDYAGRVVGVSIATADEDQYFVQDSQILGQLLERLREEVAVTGLVHEAGGKKLLTRCSLSRHSHEHA